MVTWLPGASARLRKICSPKALVAQMAIERFNEWAHARSVPDNFGQARRRIDPVVRPARMEPPQLPTETLAVSCARNAGARLQITAQAPVTVLTLQTLD